MLLEQAQFLENIYTENIQNFTQFDNGFLHDKTSSNIAVQNSFYIACEKIESISTSPNPVGWMMNTVRFTSLNMLKARKKHMDLIISWDDLQRCVIPCSVDEKEDSLVEQCKFLLSKSDFYLLEQIVIQGVSYCDVSHRLGISIWACRKRVQRLLQKLQTKL